jgi:predicted transcriptional regulator
MQREIQVFAEKEEEFSSLLVQIGLPRNIAVLLVFLANIPEATSREIERGTGLRQSEVSVALRYLAELGWVKSREIPSHMKGRHMGNFSLAIPVREIMDRIGKQKRDEVNHKLALIRKMRSFT